MCTILHSKYKCDLAVKSSTETGKLCKFGSQNVRVALSILAPMDQVNFRDVNIAMTRRTALDVYTTHMLLTFLHFILFVSTYISQFYYNQSQKRLLFVDASPFYLQILSSFSCSYEKIPGVCSTRHVDCMYSFAYLASSCAITQQR